MCIWATRDQKRAKPWTPPELCPSCQTSVVNDHHEVAWRCQNSFRFEKY
ncbi:MAG: hypothetical protein JSR46_03275 [Verrucomicrobia bacterium]|nr:hypothetical protein [Verrucomicrobiota bacterium]